MIITATKCVPMETPVVAMRPAVVSPPVSGPHKAGLGQDRAVWEDVDQLKPRWANTQLA